MAFPVSPSDGQTYLNNGVTYVYNAGMGVWDIQGASSTSSVVTSVAGRVGTITLTAADINAGTFPGALVMTPHTGKRFLVKSNTPEQRTTQVFYLV